MESDNAEMPNGAAPKGFRDKAAFDTAIQLCNEDACPEEVSEDDCAMMQAQGGEDAIMAELPACLTAACSMLSRPRCPQRCAQLP